MLSKKLQAACNAPVVVDDGSISFVESEYEFTHTGSSSLGNYDDVTISYASTAGSSRTSRRPGQCLHL